MFYTLKKKDSYEEALAEAAKFTTDLGSLLRGKNGVAPDDERSDGRKRCPRRHREDPAHRLRDLSQPGRDPRAEGGN